MSQKREDVHEKLDKLNNEITFNGIKTTYVDLISIESKNIADYLLYLKEYKTFYLRWWISQIT